MSKKKERNAFEFFNCDAEKSHASMNPLYETNIYRDTRDSRRKLWKRIKAEVNAGRINVDNMDKVRDAIINDLPSNANQYIKYGVILTKTMND